MTATKNVQSTSAKILVVDDEALVRNMTCDGLAAAGYAVSAASSGEEALQLVQAGRPACILLDIMMPDLDGYDTCAALKADPQTAPIPVLLISATTDARVMEQAKRVGAAAVLRKPVRMDELRRAVSQALAASV
jgi:putative two-component system response regulator